MNSIVKYTLTNLFFSKKQFTYKLENLIKVKMIYKGQLSRTNDSRRYYLRLYFNNEKDLDIGECSNYVTIEEKVRYYNLSISNSWQYRKVLLLTM